MGRKTATLMVILAVVSLITIDSSSGLATRQYKSMSNAVEYLNGQGSDDKPDYIITGIEYDPGEDPHVWGVIIVHVRNIGSTHVNKSWWSNQTYQTVHVYLQYVAEPKINLPIPLPQFTYFGYNNVDGIHGYTVDFYSARNNSCEVLAGRVPPFVKKWHKKMDVYAYVDPYDHFDEIDEYNNAFSCIINLSKIEKDNDNVPKLEKEQPEKQIDPINNGEKTKNPETFGSTNPVKKLFRFIKPITEKKDRPLMDYTAIKKLLTGKLFGAKHSHTIRP